MKPRVVHNLYDMMYRSDGEFCIDWWLLDLAEIYQTR